MAKEDVERFVGLLVSDDDFIEALKRNFDRAIVDRNLALDKKERLVLKESFETYVLPGTEIPTATEVLHRWRSRSLLPWLRPWPGLWLARWPPKWWIRW